MAEMKSIRVSDEVWAEFKEDAARRGMTAGECLAQLMSDSYDLGNLEVGDVAEANEAVDHYENCPLKDVIR